MKRYIRLLSTESDCYHDSLTKIGQRREPGGQVLGDPSKLAHYLVNLVILYLLPDRDGSLKIGVVVAEDCPIWEIVLPSLGYQVLQIHLKYPPTGTS